MLGHVAASVLVLGIMASDASAMSKLCIKNDPTLVEVPVDPRFIVRRDNLPTMELRALRRGDSTFRRSSGRLLPYRVDVIDELWASVAVTAGVGAEIAHWSIVGGGCKGRRYRVVARPPRRTPSPAIAAATTLGDRSEYVQLEWRNPKDVGWTRVDWAYTEADLDRGRYGSHHDRSDREREQHHIVLDADWQIVFVRVMRFHVDGAQSTWRGWVHRRGPRVRIGNGRPPVEGAPEPRCEVAAPRPLPVDPELYVEAYESRFVAKTATGDALPLEVSRTGRRHASLVVRASEGTEFQLHRLPVSRRCDGTRWLRATSDRSRDEAPVVVAADNGGCTANVVLADADTWGRIEVTTSTGVESEQVASEVIVTPIESYTNLRRKVTITPIWSGAVRGRSWSGWVQAAQGCSTLEFGTDPRAPLAPSAMQAHPSRPNLDNVAAATPAQPTVPWRPLAILLLVAALAFPLPSRSTLPR